jgi:hypothetical protein
MMAQFSPDIILSRCITIPCWSSGEESNLAQLFHMISSRSASEYPKHVWKVENWLQICNQELTILWRSTNVWKWDTKPYITTQQKLTSELVNFGHLTFRLKLYFLFAFFFIIWKLKAFSFFHEGNAHFRTLLPF